MTEVPDRPIGRYPFAEPNGSGSVSDVDAVKVQPLAVLGDQTTVTAALVEGLDTSVQHH